ncbi:unnamed protein product [Didymodactylos carnosus]|uniref:Uncharacterized protein n=1 Tax=Didymodactylos carnosus TaxID=1234261 RepID=A0A815GID8_9BILA|nr:unnamed protein product [Didymodactylos carnosus]CAF4198371.1 unnamed protein product [Didymodactylos carnosus]
MTDDGRNQTNNMRLKIKHLVLNENEQFQFLFCASDTKILFPNLTNLTLLSINCKRFLDCSPITSTISYLHILFDGNPYKNSISHNENVHRYLFSNKTNLSVVIIENIHLSRIFDFSPTINQLKITVKYYSDLIYLLLNPNNITDLNVKCLQLDVNEGNFLMWKTNIYCESFSRTVKDVDYTRLKIGRSVICFIRKTEIPQE